MKDRCSLDLLFLLLLPLLSHQRSCSRCCHRPAAMPQVTSPDVPAAASVGGKPATPDADAAVPGSSSTPGRRKWLPTPLRKLSHNKLTTTPSLSAGELPPVAGGRAPPPPPPPKPPLKKTNSERKVQVSPGRQTG